MPTVPVITQRQIAPQGLPNARVNEQASPGAFGASLAQPLAQASKLFEGIALEERDKADTAAVLEAGTKLNDLEQTMLFDPQNGALTRRGKNAFDLPNQVLPQFDAETQRIEGELGNDRQKLAFRRERTQRRAGIQLQLNRHEATEREGYYDQQDASALQSSRGAAGNFYNNEERIAEELGRQEAIIDARGTRKGLPQAQIDDLKQQTRSGTHADVIERFIARGEWRKGSIYFGEVRDQIDGDQATRIEGQLTSERRRAEAEVKSQQAELRQSLRERVSDATAAYRFGLSFDAPPKRQEFVAALGAEDGNKAFESFQREEQLGVDLAGIAVMSPEEQADLLKSRAPTGTEGAAANAERYRVLASQTQQLRKQRDDDPAAYVARYSQHVQAAAQDLQSPEGAQAYARASVAEQERLGVTHPRILTSAQASSIAQSFYIDADKPENVARLVQSEQQKWGSHWPQVFRELAAKKLPAAALAIGRGMDSGAATRLASVAAIDMDELKQGVDVPKDDVINKLTGSMQDFQLSLDGIAGGANTFSAMYDAAERLSYSYLRQGKKVGDATEQAYREVIGDHYQFTEINGRKLRVPAQYDLEIIEDEARRSLTTINPGELLPAVPTRMGNPATAEQDLLRAIRKQGYFVTSGDQEESVTLFLGGRPVLRSDGTPYALRFDDLQTADAARRSELGKRYIDSLLQGGGAEN